MDTLNVFFIADDEGRDEIGNDHVTAIFPEVPWSNVYLTGYARLGQHCAIYPGYIRDCRPATEAGVHRPSAGTAGSLSGRPQSR